jgi:hypothetical protein
MLDDQRVRRTIAQQRPIVLAERGHCHVTPSIGGWIRLGTVCCLGVRDRYSATPHSFLKYCW